MNLRQQILICVLENDVCIDTSEIPYLAKSLTSYLEEVGLTYHKEAEIDEAGRARIKGKIEERKFQEEHLDEIIDTLKGNGLVNVLSYVLTDEKYRCSRFGPSNEQCEYCNKEYIEGGISNEEQKEQWCDGVDAKDLHDLSCHPDTFVNKFGNLRKIHRLVCDAKDYTPVFISHPEIMLELNAWAHAYGDYLNARGEAFGFWMDYRGGVDLWHEEEEIEESLELKRLQEKEILLHEKEHELEAKAKQSVKVLQRKYDTIRGVETDESVPDWKIRNFWSDQLMIFNIYQINAPKLLTQFSEQEIAENPVKLYRI